MNDLMGTSACINSANSSDKAQPFWVSVFFFYCQNILVKSCKYILFYLNLY